MVKNGNKKGYEFAAVTIFFLPALMVILYHEKCACELILAKRQ